MTNAKMKKILTRNSGSAGKGNGGKTDGDQLPACPVYSGDRLERMCRMIRRMEDVGDIRELTALL